MKTRQQKIDYLTKRLSDRDISILKNASEEKIDRLYFIEMSRERKEVRQMVSAIFCNWLAIAFMISFGFNFVQLFEWLDKRQVEKRIEENKRRKNHFKEMK